MTTPRLSFYLLSMIVLLLPLSLWAADISNTKHNLSLSGPGPIKSTSEEEICIFCHTPHKARTDTPYLWNRQDSTAIYSLYDSSTLFAIVGQPSGASKLCLSCHDGTIALGALISLPIEIPFAGGIRFLPEGPSRLGSDISDDHPVSFLYDEALALAKNELNSPSQLTNEVMLDDSGLMQCTSCHDPHKNTFGKFLVKPNIFSDLCITCHNLKDWTFNVHATSTATWNGVGTDPWPHTDFNTVQENACENCHRPHTAGGHIRLLNYLLEEDNCLACHNGNVAGKNIETELLKTYRHAVQDFSGIHDAAEDFTQFPSTHVECVDCHNPHRVNKLTATAPNVPGILLGVTGITAAGTQIEKSAFSYEICFKCHADNNVLTFSEISRQLPQINTRLEFDLTNPSYHPIEGAGNNPNVPSLLTPYTVNSVIYCTDCHNNNDSPVNGGIGPNGPHGSVYNHILERNYATSDFTNESSFKYALCYKCHDRTSILNNESFSEHSKHIQGENAPCSACHDPHGISSTQGNLLNNSHLINFDINIVQPNSNGQLRFDDLGTLTGRCYLRCHGENHNPETYPD